MGDVCLASPDEFDVERDRTLRRLHGDGYEEILRQLRDEKEAFEEKHLLSPHATTSSSSVGRIIEEEHKLDNRTDYARDRDRIIYSNAFYKLAGKTQVFITPNNPLISTRMTHVIQVAQVARSLARALGLNEDLVEAMALGHDLGHSPFGHAGEEVLSRKCQEAGLPPFRHNEHSLRVVDTLEKNGKGLNLTWEVREGILCHDGESESENMAPERKREFLDLYGLDDVELKKNPSTPEACLVRLCDRIAYAGKDIEDAIEAGLVKREEIPEEYASLLGNTNKKIMDTVVKDVVLNFLVFVKDFKEKNRREPNSQEVRIRISPEIRAAVNGLIGDFNYPRIYMSKQNQTYIKQTSTMVSSLFDSFYNEARDASMISGIKRLDDFLTEDEGDGLCEGLFSIFLSMSIGKAEDIAEEMRKAMGSNQPLETYESLPEETCVELKRLFAKASEEGEEGMDAIGKALGAARLRIRKDNLLAREVHYFSTYYFIQKMSDEYLAEASSAEVARDFLASLADRTAISIFKRLNIPQSIV